jgi:LPS export ABC transporter protein LptC
MRAPLTTYHHSFIPAICIVGMLVSGCINDPEEVERVTTYEDLPLQTIVQSKIVYTDSARTQFIIEAGLIERYPTDDRPVDEFSEGIRVLSYDRSGELESELTAERASNFTEENLMVARDSVILRNNEGKMLNSEELYWDGKEGRIYTDKFVRITTPTEILYGDGLEANEDFSRYEILNIKGRIRIDSEEDSTSTDNATFAPQK